VLVTWRWQVFIEQLYLNLYHIFLSSILKVNAY
jgi:hypothetical protein